MRSAAGAIANDPIAAEAASAVLKRDGNAVDACISAFFCASAAYPGVLLGPVHLLVTGPGVGAHLYDGSPLQPGKDAPRPRGFRDDDPIPVAALIAAPASITALATAHAQDGKVSMQRLVSRALRIAEASGARSRASLLQRIALSGSLVMRDPAFSRGLLDVAGRAVGGNLTITDLRTADTRVATQQSFAQRASVAQTVLRVRDQASRCHLSMQPIVVCACDKRGMLAAMHFASDPQGVWVESLELSAPRIAIPVRRGVRRVAPGERLTVPAPIFILFEGHVPRAAIGLTTQQDMASSQIVATLRDGLTLDQSLKLLMAAESHVRSAVVVMPSTGRAAGVRMMHVGCGR